MQATLSRKLQEAFDLFQVNSMKDLHVEYMRLDQRLFRQNLWDYDDSVSELNMAREILESVDPGLLDDDDRMWWYEIVWFWYHHAISAAVRKLDKKRAQYFACAALAYQEPGHPNRVTRLLWYLVYDCFAEAKRWVYETQMGPDHETETEILDEYEKGEDSWAAFKKL